MPDRTPDELARYWDSLTLGSDPSATALDPSLAEVVRRFERAEDVPGPDPTFLANLTEDLMHASTIPQPIPGNHPGWTRPTAHRPLRDRLSRPAASLPTIGSRWFPALVSTALLLITIGIAGYATLDRDGSPGPSGSAVQAPATPSPEGVVSDYLLAEITIPAEAVPSGDRLTAAIGVIRLEPGDRNTWGPRSGSGLLLQYVISGDYWVWSDTEIQVIRAGGAAAEVAASTETMLTAGDTLLMGFTGRLSVANTGTAPVEVLSWSLFDYPVITAGGTPVPGLIVDGDDLPWATLEPNGALTLRLRLVRLASDAVLEAEPGSLQVGVAAPGQIGSAPSSMDGTIASFSIDGRPVVVFVVTIASASGSATPMP